MKNEFTAYEPNITIISSSAPSKPCLQSVNRAIEQCLGGSQVCVCVFFFLLFFCYCCSLCFDQTDVRSDLTMTNLVAICLPFTMNLFLGAVNNEVSCDRDWAPLASIFSVLNSLSTDRCINLGQNNKLSHDCFGACLLLSIYFYNR